MPTLTFFVRAAAVSVALLCGVPLTAAATPSTASSTTGRVIVKYRADVAAQGDSRAAAANAEDGRAVVRRLESRMAGMAQRRGLALRAHRALTDRTQVVLAKGIDSEALARRLSADPDVESAIVDLRVRALATVPGDPLYAAGGTAGPAAGQWYLKTPNSTIRSAIDATTAWDFTRGNARVVVAVVDTGVRFEHPDLGRVANGGKLLDGYDFVSNSDGVDIDSTLGRDADASDPGDWITYQEDNTAGNYYHCTTPDAMGNYQGSDSAWHGTQVAGILGALTNNSVGMAGAGWNTVVLPVRALGKCGGFVSDVVAGMRWAAGLAVPGVATNPNPAKIINLSLGTTGACGAYQDAVDAVTAAGAVVVAAAGNTNGHAVGAPANCTGVIAVGGLRHTGTKVGFSDLGSEVSISAPGGNCVNSGGACLYPLLSTTNTGLQGPGSSTYTDGLNRVTIGTSFSAPLVSATAALIRTVYPGASPTQVRALIRSSARPFPTTGGEPGSVQCTAPQVDGLGNPIDQGECYCTTSTCGAGMLDMGAAVQAARTQALAATGVQALFTVSPAYPVVGQAITLDASGSVFSGGSSLANANWELLSGAGASLSAASGGQTTVSTSSSGTLQIKVTVTDSAARVSTLTQSIYVAPDPSAPPPASSSSGGGALSWAYLLALLAAVVAAWRLRAPARA